MKLGVQVGLSPDHIVLDGDQLPLPNGAQPKIFGPCPLWPNSWRYRDAIWYAGRPRPRPHCVTRGPSCPQKGHNPQFSARLLWLNGRPSQLLLSFCSYKLRIQQLNIQLFVLSLFGIIPERTATSINHAPR